MTCISCGSVNVGEFPAEICIHFSGPENLDKPHLLVFPQLMICRDCGAAQFVVPEDKLRLLSNDADLAA